MYYSFFTSLLFFPVGLYLYTLEHFPKIIAVLVLGVSIISSFHHTRRYDEDYQDALQFLDLSLVGLLGASLVYYFKHYLWLWIMCFFIVITKIILLQMTSVYDQSLSHAFLHLLCGFSILGLC